MDTPSPPAAPAPAEPSPPPPPAAAAGSPTDFLKGVVGKRVVVRLTSGIDYHGTFPVAFCPQSRMLRGSSGVLSCLDGYMNIALEQTEEHVGGTVTNRYGDAFIRGNNGACFRTLCFHCVLMHPQCCTYLPRNHYDLCVNCWSVCTLSLPPKRPWPSSFEVNP